MHGPSPQWLWIEHIFPSSFQTKVIKTSSRRAIEGLLTESLPIRPMGISIKHTILFLVVISSVFISLPQAKGGCSGGCSVSGGGVSSSSFMGDRSVNIDMSSFDEFVRDNLDADPRATLQAISLSQYAPLNANSSLNQTSNGNSSQVNTTSDNRTVKLGALGMQDNRLSTLAFTVSNNNMF
jgi:hypothetical protein